MDRQFYLELAAAGLRMPIGADLILHEQPDPEAVKHAGAALGRVLEVAAQRYRTPLAFPLMDLTLEKADLLHLLGIPAANLAEFHLDAAPLETDLARLAGALDAPFSRRHQAHIESVRYIALSTALFPIGMSIGPFSLMTKLLADPITPLALAGRGLTAEDDPSVLLVERALILAEMAVHRSVRAQAQAGACAMLICEPAASRVYLSPRQLEAGSDIFERYVIQPHLRLKALLNTHDVDLIFHDCGEPTDFMVCQFAERLDPAILSLGSSRKLWEDAALVPKRTVLFGNLPTKSFYSDGAMPLEKVQAITSELLARMRACGHPHILGSECDVLHVPAAGETIRRKVAAVLTTPAR